MLPPPPEERWLYRLRQPRWVDTAIVGAGRLCHSFRYALQYGKAMSRVMSLDIGTRRIGVAVSDESGLIAQPLTVITREGTARDVACIVQMVRERGVDQIVVGLPITLQGNEAETSRKVMEFVSHLRNALEIPIVLVDERLSTAEADKRMLEANLRRSSRRQKVDAVAAALILERYLSSRKST